MFGHKLNLAKGFPTPPFGRTALCQIHSTILIDIYTLLLEKKENL